MNTLSQQELLSLRFFFLKLKLYDTRDRQTKSSERTNLEMYEMRSVHIIDYERKAQSLPSNLRNKLKYIQLLG